MSPLWIMNRRFVLHSNLYLLYDYRSIFTLVKYTIHILIVLNIFFSKLSSILFKFIFNYNETFKKFVCLNKLWQKLFQIIQIVLETWLHKTNSECNMIARSTSNIGRYKVTKAHCLLHRNYYTWVKRWLLAHC